MGLRCFVPDVAPLRFFACAAPVLMSRDFVFWVAPHQPRHCEVPFLGLRRSSPDVALSCLWGEPPHPWCCAVRGFRAGRRGLAAYRRVPGDPSSGVPFVCPAPRKKPALRAPAFPYAGMPPGSVSCLLSYSISHVAPECSSSSTERILLCALTSSTCRATSRS